MNAILQVENLTKQYADFKLDHVSFSVPKGTIMGLIGENGAGKSTTINAILDLIHNSPAEEAGSACNKVFIIHSKSLLSQISIQVLIIFHEYSILEEKGRNNQHLPYG